MKYGDRLYLNIGEHKIQISADAIIINGTILAPGFLKDARRQMTEIYAGRMNDKKAAKAMIGLMDEETIEIEYLTFVADSLNSMKEGKQ